MNKDIEYDSFFMNSYPRTGSTFLKFGITMFLNFRIYEQIHSAFLAGKKIENTMQIITIREPINSITSNIYRAYGEYIYKTAHDKNSIKIDNFLKEGLGESFDFHNNFYHELYSNAYKNEQCLIIFFDSFTKDIRKELIRISKYSGKSDKIYNLPSSEHISDHIFNIMNNHKFNNYATLTHGNLPRQVGEEYFYIKQYVESKTNEISKNIENYNKFLQRDMV
jgi:hypothetical protein